MIDEILPGFYHLDLPYPRHPLRNINVYLAKGGARSLLIDTGINIEECHETLTSDLTHLGILPEKLDFFITHGHGDHFGGLHLIAGKEAKVYITRQDAALMLDTASFWQTRLGAAGRHGIPERLIREALTNPPFNPPFVDNYRFHYLKQGDTLAVGDFQFNCIETPGHSKGHMCLYLPKEKLLVTGDHILIDVSPNVSSWMDDEDPLSNYLVSLAKVFELEVARVLPAHRRLFSDLRSRVNELQHHHHARAEEAISILRKKGRQNAYRIAMQMTWDIPHPWEETPFWQKFAATGEALAHLKYLENLGKVRRETEPEETTFALV